MTPDEIKIEIHKIIDTLPEEFLSEALVKINNLIEEHEANRYDKNLEKVMKDNAELLKRLAD